MDDSCPAMWRIAGRCLSLENVVTDFYFLQRHMPEIVSLTPKCPTVSFALLLNLLKQAYLNEWIVVSRLRTHVMCCRSRNVSTSATTRRLHPRVSDRPGPKASVSRVVSETETRERARTEEGEEGKEEGEECGSAWAVDAEVDSHEEETEAEREQERRREEAR